MRSVIKSRRCQNCMVQIVDETDRLLKQSYQGWLAKVLEALHPNKVPLSGLPQPQRLVKLVVSATPTHDPTKLAKLALQAPRFAAVCPATTCSVNACYCLSAGSAAVISHATILLTCHSLSSGDSLLVAGCRFIAIQSGEDGNSLPVTLQQFQLTTSASHKPRALLALLRALKTPPATPKKAPFKGIVFAASVESTHRVAVFLAACPSLRSVPVFELSSLRSRKKQAAAVASFRKATSA